MAVWLKSSTPATRHQRSAPGQTKEVVGPDTVGPRLEVFRTTWRRYHVDTHLVTFVVPDVGLAALLDPGDDVGSGRIAGLVVLTADPPEVRDVLVLGSTLEADGGDVD
jgi:hypothetical protein